MSDRGLIALPQDLQLDAFEFVDLAEAFDLADATLDVLASVAFSSTSYFSVPV